MLEVSGRETYNKGVTAMTLKKINSKGMNRLQKKVARVVNAMVSNTYPLENVVKDILHGGAASGMINELIWTVDCVKFYNLYRKEINALLVETLSSFGECAIHKLFSNWDNDDPLAQEDYNKNILAWFGFEETVRRFAFDFLED